MRRDEIAITIIALPVGLNAGLFIIFVNLSATYLVKFFAEGWVPLGHALFVAGITAVSGGVVAWLLGWWLRRAHPAPEAGLKRNLTAKDLQRRRHEAKTGLLELAHRQGGFTVDEAVQLTGFGRIESEYLIDELLASQALKVGVEGDTLVYRSGRG